MSTVYDRLHAQLPRPDWLEPPPDWRPERPEPPENPDSHRGVVIIDIDTGEEPDHE